VLAASRRGSSRYPDFIAVDADGVFWIIEGKSDDSAYHRDVQVKKVAAEDCVRFINDDRRFGMWRYLFCTETAINNSHDNWDSLIAAARGGVGI
jgi:type III restriction enzyme